MNAQRPTLPGDRGRRGDPCTRDFAGPDGWCPERTTPLRARRTASNAGRERAATLSAKKVAPHQGPRRRSRAVGDMQLILFEAFLAVAQGTKEPRVLTALATGARAILDIAGVVTYDEQLADMRARLADLEARRGR